MWLPKSQGLSWGIWGALFQNVTRIRTDLGVSREPQFSEFAVYGMQMFPVAHCRSATSELRSISTIL